MRVVGDPIGKSLYDGLQSRFAIGAVDRQNIGERLEV